MKRWAVILPLIWFPLIQPLLEDALRPGGSLRSTLERLAWLVVTAAGAVSLLKTALVVVALYAIMVAVIAVRARSAAERRLAAVADQPALRNTIAGRSASIVLGAVEREETILEAEAEELHRLEAGIESLKGAEEASLPLR